MRKWIGFIQHVTRPGIRKIAPINKWVCEYGAITIRRMAAAAFDTLNFLRTSDVRRRGSTVTVADGVTPMRPNLSIGANDPNYQTKRRHCQQNANIS